MAEAIAAELPAWEQVPLGQELAEGTPERAGGFLRRLGAVRELLAAGAGEAAREGTDPSPLRRLEAEAQALSARIQRAAFGIGA